MPIAPWQLWPSSMIYAPLVPWLFWLSVRYRMSPLDLLLVNPGFSHGGWVVDSKFNRYLLFGGADDFVPTVLFNAEQRLIDHVFDQLVSTGIEFPVIVKPDMGLMGKAVRKVENADQLAEILSKSPVDLLIQP